ncbi:lysophospholipase L1-like esterase [Opitutaceae bacterium TAV1]|nr:lysophospholipase L1-like esterase [Opitutaceae bacterium TAV1]
MSHPTLPGGRCLRPFSLFVASILLLLVPASGDTPASAPGRDVVAAFTRAARGEPLRYVAIGGSITQASGEGWIGPWLREQFPESRVTIINSGMSATGSSLGIFRAERDIIAHQPDLVAIEYCVNDGGLPDEQAVRYMETLVVRLKSLPRPPAIVIVEAATRHGINAERHRKVARHYGLAHIDMQAAVDTHLFPDAPRIPLPRGVDRGGGGEAAAAAWAEIFSDNVHPNKTGHALYARAMAATLRPLADEARRLAASSARADADPQPAALPAPLSEKPLLLDARMVPLQGLSDPAGAWRPAPAPTTWYGRFFQGVLAASQPGAVLHLPFRGTTVGLFYELNPDHGSFYASVDGALPAQVFTNSRTGYTSYLVARNLPAREHVLTLVLPPATAPGETAGVPKSGGNVRLGYLLVAGETGATREPSPAGTFDAGKLQALRFATLPAATWRWAGPFPAAAGPDGIAPLDAREALTEKFLPEPGEPLPDSGTAKSVSWRPVTDTETAGAATGRVDFHALTGSTAPGIAYATTQIRSDKGGPAILSAEVDYYAHLWINGERVMTLDGPHPVPVFLPVTLRAGINDVFLKIGAGSAGFNFRLRVAEVD